LIIPDNLEYLLPTFLSLDLIIMKTILKGFLIFVTALTTISCSKSGTRALEQGDYYNAVLQSVEKLKKDTDNDKSLSVLPDAYRFASEELVRNASMAKNANQQFRWENVFASYNKLNNMYDLIAKCPSCRRIISPESFFKEAEEAQDMAANERYIYGSEMLQKGTIESGRSAFDSFEKLFQFAPDFKDVREKIEEALNAGSYHVVVEQPIVNSRAYELSHIYFQERVDEFLRENRRLNKFIRFYDPAEAKKIALKPDHVIRLEFVDFVVGQTFVARRESILTSPDSVKTGTANFKGETVDVYAKVTANYFKNRKVVISTGVLAMEIIDFQNDRLLKKEEFSGEYTWVNEWASFNGDERALTDEEIETTKNREDIPPSPQQLFIELSKPIYDQFTRRVRRFYNDY
jgi:hypothetical protein